MPLADQLMLPLGIGAYLGSGGGVLRSTGLSRHGNTRLEILGRFLEIGIQVERRMTGGWLSVAHRHSTMNAISMRPSR
jgi:hypothetical protein